MAERHIDGRMSAKAQREWPGALIVREVDGERVTYWLERPGQERLGLGPHLPEVYRGLDALRKAEEAGR